MYTVYFLKKIYANEIKFEKKNLAIKVNSRQVT